MRRQAYRLLFVCQALCLLACPGVVPGSGPYEPVSEREGAVFARAVRTVQPQDVRASLDPHRNTLIAWAGIIRSFEVTEEDGSAVVRFDVEHRYFDWIEDFSSSSARYLLSSRGEGIFRSAWSMPVEALDPLSQTIQNGDMLVVYGFPAEVRDEVVGLYPTEYVRLIDSSLVNDEALDYGREVLAESAQQPVAPDERGPSSEVPARR